MLENEIDKVILRVDSNAISYKILIEMFKHNGFEVEHIDSGRKTPVVEYKDQYFIGHKLIMFHFDNRIDPFLGYN